MWEKIKAELKALFAEMKLELKNETANSAPAPAKSESPQAPAAAVSTAAAPAPENGGKKKEEKASEEKPKEEKAKATSDEEEEEEELETEGKGKTESTATAPAAEAKVPTIAELQNEIVQLKNTISSQAAKITELENKEQDLEKRAGAKSSQTLMKQGIPPVQTTADTNGKDKPAAKNADAELLAEYESLMATDKKAANAFANKHYAAIGRASHARDVAAKKAKK
jgi:uncharacterized coiled-coil protein SlyX